MRRVPPRKARIVMDKVKGMRAIAATQMLRYVPNKSAEIISKLIAAAMANARENHNLNDEDLVVTGGWVDGGPTMKRIRARAMGRANRILKRTSHITIVVEDIPAEIRAKRVHKPKPPIEAVPVKAKRAKKVEAPVEVEAVDAAVAATMVGEMSGEEDVSTIAAAEEAVMPVADEVVADSVEALAEPAAEEAPDAEPVPEVPADEPEKGKE